MGRILSVDFGRKRVGLAVTDPLRIIATPLATVPSAEAAEFIKTYAAENGVDLLVIGLPVQMDGSPSESQQYLKPFINRLRKILPDMHIEFADERFTSVLAKRAIIEGGVKKMDRRDKGLVDRVSAVIILQWYMDKIVRF